MYITKQVSVPNVVIDTSKIKKGDRIKLEQKSFPKYSYTATILLVTEEMVRLEIEENGYQQVILAKDLHENYLVSKIEIKTSKFTTGQLYRVEDANSCDKFDVLIMTVSDSEISALKLKSASAMSIKESDIDTRYKFTKIKTVEEDKTVKLLYGKDKDEWFEHLCKEAEVCSKSNNRPFFTGFKPSFYFKTGDDK